jgi:hypothetical protein
MSVPPVRRSLAPLQGAREVRTAPEPASPAWLRALAACFAFVLLTVSPSAHASVCSAFAVDELWCNQTQTDGVGLGDGLWSIWEYDDCGVGPDYLGSQDAWEIHCSRSGPMTITVDLLEACDLDLFLLTDTCDGKTDCVTHSRRGVPLADTVTFDCVEGATYYAVVEPFSSPACTLNLTWDYRISTTCAEGPGATCTDGIDNDADGNSDCRDSDCPACTEVCDNGRDDDRDNLIDCNDSSCNRFAPCCDKDGDGYWATGAVCGGNDCNDNNAAIRPGATELAADGIDQNCDTQEACFTDADRDNYGATTTGLTPVMSCIDAQRGFANNARDCNDSNALVRPGATELPADNTDADCDGREQCWRDADLDDFGVNIMELSTDFTCRAGTAAPNTRDCNDANAAINPGATETAANGTDQNCDNLELCYTDEDGDNYGVAATVTSTDLTCMLGNAAPVRGDCADNNASVNPAATENPGNGVDEDCNGRELCYRDTDGDTWGGATTVGSTSLTCTGATINSRTGDCNDALASINPGATDTPANGVDQNCDGLETCYVDVDLDDYGATGTTTSADLTCRAGAAAPNNTDCNDANAAINPNASETVANRTDENCDGKESCWVDADLDTWGGTSQVLSVNLDCAVSGASARSGDCNDALASVSPSATEIIGDLIDQTCDGLERCYVDADADGVGGSNSGLADVLCRNAGFAATSGDCNEANPTIYPGATEVPVDGVDQNCDTLESCYRDNDRDDYGTATVQTSTDLTCKRGTAAPNTLDCNDNAVAINPAATEITADGVDQNCNGLENCWLDADLDDYGVSTSIVSSADLTCKSGTAAPNTTDCNDNSAAVRPNATETPADRVDQNCDGRELCYRDTDVDQFGATTTINSLDLACDDAGLASVNTDCNDNSAAIRPNATETPADGVDGNCDTQELCYVDNDRDSYGSSNLQASATLTCLTAGLSPNRNDCNDGNAAIHPGAFDDPNTPTDENCDGARPCWQDLDRDGWGSAQVVVVPGGVCTAVGLSDRTGDCDDDPVSGARAFPGAPETPGDGVDADCNGQELCFVDSDLDTWGNANSTTPSSELTCAATGLAARAGDCNDAANAVHPGATEAPADATDQDCNGMELCFIDADGDSYGTSATTPSLVLTCTAPGSSVRSDDCNDLPIGGAPIHPNAPELTASGVDEDCDGLEACWVDGDRDGAGGPNTQEIPSLTCATAGFVNSSSDCNDADPLVRPGAAESIADGRDSDCDGNELCYRDLDRDGFGSTDISPSPVLTCSADGVADDMADCDDQVAAVYPGAIELPADGVDQNCDTQEACYVDSDLDTWGTTQLQASTSLACAASGVASRSGDCDDARASVSPSADELTANGRDETCDGLEACWIDGDGDTYGGDAVGTSPDLSCTPPGLSPNTLDCDDAAATVRPGAFDDPATAVDEDCDGVKQCWVDQDLDGFGSTDLAPSPTSTCANGLSSVGGDCDDDETAVYPGAIDSPADGIDADCDGRELCFEDLDGDRWGGDTTSPSPSMTCAGAGISARTGDCNDAVAAIAPGASEGKADGVDQDCDGVELCYADADLDGFGRDGTSASSTALDCQTPGASPRNDDCNDASDIIHPSAPERPVSGVDEDCDGLEACWSDADGDSYGGQVPATSAQLDCAAPGVSPAFSDCNDLNPQMHPGAAEVVANSVDEDCDGYEDCYRDSDADDHGSSAVVASATLACSADGFAALPDDCDDARADVHPGAVEVDASGVDEDCNGEERCYVDGDLDGYGRAALGVTTDFSCRTDGWSLTPDDCRDAGPGAELVHPNAAEIPGNGVDEDCDGRESCYVDGDGDGFGGTVPVLTDLFDCSLPGAAASGDDCDDGRTEIHPDAPETPANGVDEDCDGADACFQDRDGDGFGSAAVIPGVDLSCAQAGEALVSGDCLDQGDLPLPAPYSGSIPADDVGPSVAETCNGVDDNCNGAIDDDDDALTGAPVWRADADGDGFGSDLVSWAMCIQPAGSSAVAGDCADDEPAIKPGALERCDGVDNDCDRLVDAADDSVTDASAWWADRDNDGHGSGRAADQLLACTRPDGYAPNGDDCVDDNRDVFPGNNEVPYDGVDQDCDAGDLVDVDQDGFVAAEAAGGDDCNDRDANVSPGEDDTPNGIDDDCDHQVDEDTRWSDDDGDGYSENGGDCDDGDSFVKPSGEERCDGVDDDCDGIPDNGTTCFDDDRDGFTEDAGDCNDADQAVRPGRTEIDDNGVDDNCDGVLDLSASDPDRDGWSIAGGDCAPNDPGSRPGLPETPDGKDNDCDGLIDEGTRAYDDDGDGYSELVGDCDDASKDAHPGAIEAPNGRDDDCNGDVDEGTERYDDDGDGLSEIAGDCDDDDDGVYPGAREFGNGIDDDCDGDVDDLHLDADGDGFSVAEGDCDDTTGWVRPDMEERCDGLDNDCDGEVDPDCDVVTDEDIGLTEKPGCACDAAPGIGAAPWLVALTLFSLRRRAPARAAA